MSVPGCARRILGRDSNTSAFCGSAPRRARQERPSFHSRCQTLSVKTASTCRPYDPRSGVLSRIANRVNNRRYQKDAPLIHEEAAADRRSLLSKYVIARLGAGAITQLLYSVLLGSFSGHRLRQPRSEACRPRTNDGHYIRSLRLIMEWLVLLRCDYRLRAKGHEVKTRSCATGRLGCPDSLRDPVRWPNFENRARKACSPFGVGLFGAASHAPSRRDH